MDSNHAVVLLAPGCLRSLSRLASLFLFQFLRPIKGACIKRYIQPLNSEENVLPFRIKIEPVSSANPEPVLFIHQKLHRLTVPQADPHLVYPPGGMPAFQFVNHAFHNLIVLPFAAAQQMIGV